MLNKIIAVACVAFVALSGWAVSIPGGRPLPGPASLLLLVALAAMVVGHMYQHLGAALMAAFLAVGFVVEWTFEQANIERGGFIWGDLRYGSLNVFSVHLGSVPVVVPLLMAVILWPTYATVNLALHGRVVVDPRSLTWWQNLWRCVLYGFVHSWMMLMFNGLCEKWGVYHWVGHSAQRAADDMFLGDPAAPGGWLTYVVATMVVFTWLIVPRLGGDAVTRADHTPLAWADGAPIVLLGGLSLQMYLSPVNNATVANVALWTMGFFAAFTGYRFVDLLRAQRRGRQPANSAAATAHPAQRVAATAPDHLITRP